MAAATNEVRRPNAMATRGVGLPRHHPIPIVIHDPIVPQHGEMSAKADGWQSGMASSVNQSNTAEGVPSHNMNRWEQHGDQRVEGSHIAH